MGLQLSIKKTKVIITWKTANFRVIGKDTDVAGSFFLLGSINNNGFRNQ